MSWIMIAPNYEQENATHWPPRTACESAEVAAELRAYWEREIVKIPDATLAVTTAAPGHAWLDMGGMAKISRKLYELDLGDGLLISVPAKDVEDYIELIERLDQQPVEDIGGATFYRTLPSMHIGVFLSLERVATLLQRLKEILPEALAIATIENGDFNRSFVDAPVPHVTAPRRRTGPMGDA